MVKVGFIVEGTSDFIIIKSERFQHFLYHVLSLQSSEEEIIKAGCKSNIKVNFKNYVNKLNKSVDYIFIMVDQDDKEEQKRNKKYKPLDCPIIVVDEIVNYRDNSHYVKSNQIFIIMTREFEAWLLADSHLGYQFDGLPESILNPSEIIQKQEKTSNHVIIARRVEKNFSLNRAAENAPSAKRFLNKLKEISQ